MQRPRGLRPKQYLSDPEAFGKGDKASYWWQFPPLDPEGWWIGRAVYQHCVVGAARARMVLEHRNVTGYVRFVMRREHPELAKVLAKTSGPTGRPKTDLAKIAEFERLVERRADELLSKLRGDKWMSADDLGDFVRDLGGFAVPDSERVRWEIVKLRADMTP